MNTQETKWEVRSVMVYGEYDDMNNWEIRLKVNRICATESYLI